MPSSRATAVTVLPEESTSAIASRLNSSVYRFVDQGEGSKAG